MRINVDIFVISLKHYLKYVIKIDKSSAFGGAQLMSSSSKCQRGSISNEGQHQPC